MKSASSSRSNNQHKDIPGNPSPAKSSNVRLRETATPETLRVLTMEQWAFWRSNGYVVIKNAVSREQAAASAAFLWEFEEKTPLIRQPGTRHPAPKCK